MQNHSGIRLYPPGHTRGLLLMGRKNSFKSSDRLRLFIAVDLPEHIKTSLGSLQEDLKKYRLPVRWVKPENIHLTLKFLGAVDKLMLDQLCAAVDGAVSGYKSFPLGASGLGVFPGMRGARVLWAGISGDTNSLAMVWEAVESALTKEGLSRDKRFSPHLTLGRFKSRVSGERLADVIVRHGGQEMGSFTVKAVTLFESRLTQSGPIYFKRAVFALSDGNT